MNLNLVHVGSRVLIGGLLALTAACTFDPETTEEIARAAMPTVTRLDATQVAFEQVAFERESTSTLSGWGEMVIDQVAVMRRTGRPSGFVSARAADRWLVINVPVNAQPETQWPARIAARNLPPPSFIPPVRVKFGLGTDRPTATLATQVVVTDRPLTRDQLAALDSQPLALFPVTPGIEEQDPGLVPPKPPTFPNVGFAPPPPPPPWTPPDIDGNAWEIAQPHEYNVNATRAQCGIAAMANGLAYLRDSLDLPVPDYLQKGTTGSSTLPGRLDGYAARPTQGLCIGEGADACADDNGGGMFNGLYGYVENRLGAGAIALRHQGLQPEYPSACASLPDDAPVSTRAGETVTFEWMCSRVAAGDAVILGVYYYGYDVDGPAYPGSPIAPYGGHGVRVFACGEAAGMKYIRVLHDKKQDKMMGKPDEQVCTERDDGLAWELWTLSSDGDSNGKIDVNQSIFKQLEWAIAIEATSPP